MKKFPLLLLGLVMGIGLMIGILWVSTIRNVMAKSLNDELTPSPTNTAIWTEMEQLDQPLDILGDDENVEGRSSNDMLGPSGLATPVPGETQIYFIPSDNDASATVLFLYNTDTVSHTVALRGYSYNGVLVYSLNINVAATSLLRLVSDSVAASPPPSWATPAPIVTNFTDFTYLASLSLPKGVKAEGYIVFNPGTGVVDPRTDQGAIPLRFSTDPSTLFLPAVQTSP